MEKRLRNLDTILVIMLLFLPLILIVVNQEVRPSISNYAYSKYNWWFYVSLTIAGTMFMFNGTAYNSRKYNIILGCSLIGVAMTPHLDYPKLHYTFAGIFFLGNIMAMVLFSSTKQRWFKIVAGALVIIAMVGVYLTKYYSLLVAEWFGLFPFCIHYIGENFGKID